MRIADEERKSRVKARLNATVNLADVLLIAFIIAASAFLIVRVKSYMTPGRRYGNGSAQNARQIALASLMYAGDYDDTLPLTVNGQLSHLQNRGPNQLTINCPGPGTQDLPDPQAAGARPSVGWPVAVFPYAKSRGLFIDPQRADVNNIWARAALAPGDRTYDPEGATLRNQSRFPMYGYNYMFLSPLRIPQSKRGLPNAINYAVAESHTTSEPADPSGTIFFISSQRSLSDSTRGFFVVNAPGMWPIFGKGKNGLVAFWSGTPGSGDWVGTNTACPDDSIPCQNPSRSYGFAYVSAPDSPWSRCDVTFVDGHVQYMHVTDLTRGTSYATAVAGNDGAGAEIVDRAQYMWDLR